METKELIKIFAKSIRAANSGKLNVGRSTLGVQRSHTFTEA